MDRIPDTAVILVVADDDPMEMDEDDEESVLPTSNDESVDDDDDDSMPPTNDEAWVAPTNDDESVYDDESVDDDDDDDDWVPQNSDEAWAYYEDVEDGSVPATNEEAWAWYYDEANEEAGWAMQDSMDYYVLKLVPASESSIQALDKLKSSPDDLCTICLENFSDGDLSTRMPCSHIYHEHCIVQWLNTNHSCPVCRFEMPTNLT
ncbi:E3 ubiquitin ligase BIG BROTHER-related-like [Cornus florida]|uniref:E3 ubiquitin ligase BIG BROTHER-related-like n=1 Tax=Cornus florida TaxID=4283 RepID=UPI00289E8D5C|nr:E3 ubiquitin ligase BIG BROTHER-related-like [Cornus florida]